ncbi:chymotrypsin-1-like [Hyposmocoma kahamanoa]|uniref:chymotrypsin-1-like n=1 Tax=Hyposmocoma kahamanoa TaxID=1477025 RepID=UPI000E6D6240|nr:chymotrypsin-1-like [Hyposmocoma kahamanoa]
MYRVKTCFTWFTIVVILTKSRTQSLRKTGGSKFEGFIVGGRFAKIEDHPHSAYLSIQCLQETFEEFACGGSILNQVMLLTAAHCFADCRPGTRTTVAVGDANKNRKQFFQVTTFTIHPQYDGLLMKNDIALAMLATPLVFNRAVKRVVLSKTGIYDKPATQAGWGVTDEKRETEAIFLKTTRQKVYSRNQCKTMLPQLAAGFICGTGYKDAKDYGYAAVGDSGSALVVLGYIQIGVVSHKITDVSASLIVYTEVPYYYNWIATATRALFCRYSIKQS